MKLGEIATALGATLENGDPETDITGVSGIEEAAAGQITFVANPKYAAAAKNTAASAIIVSEDFPAVALRFAAEPESIPLALRVPSTCSTSRRATLRESTPLR